MFSIYYYNYFRLRIAVYGGDAEAYKGFVVYRDGVVVGDDSAPKYTKLVKYIVANERPIDKT
jgi:hypothetical protein